MSDDEIDAFLAGQRTCRVATVGAQGEPHVAPLWFVWQQGCIWLHSLVRSQRWADLARDPRISVVIDAGVEFHELHGVEILGRADVVGDVPRTSAPDTGLAGIEESFARKYTGSDRLQPDGRHAWLRITPTKIVSWDFRKNPALRPA